VVPDWELGRGFRFRGRQWRKSACAECAGTRAPEPRGPPKKAAEPPRGLRLELNRKFLRFL
jgi:hypothetical protein